MATMNVSLPDAMKDWVNDQTASGQYANASDYVRDLIRQDRNRREKIRHMQTLVTQGLESGVTDMNMDDIRNQARHRAGL